MGLGAFLDDDDFVTELFEERLEDAAAGLLVTLIAEVRLYPLPLCWVKAFEDGLVEGCYTLVSLLFASRRILAVPVAEVDGLLLKALHLTEVEIKGLVENFKMLLGQIGTGRRAALSGR